LVGEAELEAERAAKVEQAMAAGLLQECQCCYAYGCLEKEMVPAGPATTTALRACQAQPRSPPGD
jgi:hypothetical protein